MDITKLSVTELKALAYEQVEIVERGRMNLQALQAEIAKRDEPKEPKAE
jgi:hypothetical protein